VKKILKIFSTIVIFLFILSLFGWTVYQILTENKRFGFLTEPIKFMYTFPDLFKQSVEEVKTLPKTFIRTDEKFKPINKLKKDFIVLTSYTDTNKSRSVVLMNLKNDSILKKWTFEDRKDEVLRIVNPILHPDGSLIYNYYLTRYPGLHKVDSSGNIIWKNDSLFLHHGMNLNKDGDIWACTMIPGWKATGKYILDDRVVFFNDQTITKYDHENGEIIFHKSITEILKENNLANYILKSTEVNDPIHLNDVQPALTTTRFFQEDDVFISLRNIHMILHYRPSTNELINILEGPFINQHDVDILNDSTLAIFNNNTFVGIHRKGRAPHDDKERPVNAGKFYANIVSYNFKNDSFSFIGEDVFRENTIYTNSEGLMEFIAPGTYFVEEQNSGLLWIIRDDEVIYKNVLKSQHEGYHHLPNWTRIIKYD
jgi:hypothetical protein